MLVIEIVPKRKKVEEEADICYGRIFIEAVEAIEEEEESDDENMPLFEMEFRASGPGKNWIKNLVAKQRFTVRLQELRTPASDDDVGQEITSVLERAILKEMKKREKVAPHHVVHFHLQAGYSHAFRSASFTVKEFVKEVRCCRPKCKPWQKN